MSATDVCYKDRKIMHRETWKEGRPASTPPVDETAQASADIYSHERAGLWERMHVVLGRGCWREPDMPSAQGMTQREQAEAVMMHALSAARAWQARRLREGATSWTVQDEIACRVLDAQDVGPDILASLLFRQSVNGPRVTRHLASAIVEFKPALARMMPGLLADGCWAVFMAQVHGTPPKRPRAMRWEAWQTVERQGASLLWISAQQTMRGIAEILK